MPSLNNLFHDKNPDWWDETEKLNNLNISFPLKPAPISLFCSLACKLQNHVELRSDTSRCIWAKTAEGGYIKLQISADMKILRLKSHGDDMIFQDLQNLILNTLNYYDGLLYIVK